MVILIADAAWMAYRYTRQDSWKNVDVLLVGVKKYSLDLSEYLHPTRLSAHNFQLTQDLCRSYNATGITEDIYIPQNIQLMQALRPDLQEIAVIGDCQFFRDLFYPSGKKIPSGISFRSEIHFSGRPFPFDQHAI